jgi:type IV secretory pathway TrbF-like protein
MKRGTVLLALALMLASTMTISRSQAQPPVVNSDNLNQMIAAAKTSSEHEAIAAYYDREAAENEKLAALHRASKNIYSKSNNQLHCNALIKAYERAASEAKALAAVHREMAKEAGGQSGQ